MKDGTVLGLRSFRMTWYITAVDFQQISPLLSRAYARLVDDGA